MLARRKDDDELVQVIRIDSGFIVRYQDGGRVTFNSDAFFKLFELLGD
jgi:hypothetical protein